MFQNDIVEFFSRAHWTVPLLVFIPIIVAFLVISFRHFGLQGATILTYVLYGLLFWTLTEYFLHRFVFHYQPKSERGRRIHWMFHGVHHDYPSDPLRLVMVPSISLPLSALFYFLFVTVLGNAAAAPFTAGFLVGYLFYDTTHYAVHHFPIRGRVFGRLREWHMRHHFQDPERGFGVSSPLWDFVFRTGLRRSKERVAD
ncbi:MAG: sterol desaturase family protein [Bacteroidota bacterium]|jgi:sterol desaturase/sphingolipid hydroxylase (fatty acid hydroxylase superfamily)